ncbi:MAG: aldehyde dehydrogenase family protein [Burkholderiaceae bacterium]|nr:aldehyde dehydrogenase family protein [Burkholderiaceae bacterium]
MDTASDFRLTYSTMFDPPPELHERFDAALSQVSGGLGADHAMFVDGCERHAASSYELRSPIDRDRLIGRFAAGRTEDVDAAVHAAQRAYPGWSHTPWPERVATLRRVAALIEQRVYPIAAAMAIEVGKNRMEALGEVQETADLFRWYCDQFEQNDGFRRQLPHDPLKGFVSRNRTALRPYGVWAVIAPFNFPFALAGGPIGAALVAGNTVVFKVASAASLCGQLLMKALHDAGVPPGVANLVSGAGAQAGEALVGHPAVAGITFTGSYEVGMGIVRRFAQQRWPRPCIAEMGGKNAAIVSRNADLERAATGIWRSAFGLQGQKCSACSRVLVEREAAAELRERLVVAAEAIAVGDPTKRVNWMGPVIDERAQARFRRCVERLKEVGRIYAGGRVLDEGALARGCFVAPTVAQAPRDDALWRDEQFLPLVLVSEVDSLDEAIDEANRSDYGLTAGFYGAPDEARRFLDEVEAGVVYVNRPQGATTGAWPGYQPFGGWKASGTTGKAIGSFWYLPLYLREQSQTIVE